MNIDYIHFYVKDARACCHWFVNYMGFRVLATAVSNHTYTIALKSGAVSLILSSPLTSVSPVAQFLRLHPPGVADIAFVVSDLEGVMEKAVAYGAKVLQPLQPQPLAQGGGKWGKIAAWGSLSHTLRETTVFQGDMSNFSLVSTLFEGESSTEGFTQRQSSTGKWPGELTANCELFADIDHAVLNVPSGNLEQALSWYEKILGFRRQQQFMIQTGQSGLHSQVLVHPASGVKLPINEPTSANSQIQEFLHFNRGAGVQHIALLTPRIVKAIAQLRTLGLSFLPIPPSYYSQLQQNLEELPLSTTELEEIAAQQILVDWQEEASTALLLQIFTQPIFPEPTFFFELIERRQDAQGFGEGNFRALFEAIEREQMKRGTLL